MSCCDRLFEDSASSYLPNMVGETINNGDEQLRLQKIIGRGSWGIVYLAHSLDKGKTYAVKCIANNENLPDSQLETNARELEYHERCSLCIPGVLRIHSMLQDDDRGVAFIISEYCPDGDLLDMMLGKKFAGNDGLIRSAFVQILDTVQAMHEMGVYHRDLKPENVLCKDEGQTFVLADFGFATEDEYSKEFGMGSEPFMSPEVLGGLNGEFAAYSTKHCDVWALGIILMNLVCGCLPWTRACKEDRDFMIFLFRDPDFFYNNFPISSEVNDIFKSIFTIHVEERASIADIRRNILALRTFFDHSKFGSPGSVSSLLGEDEIVYPEGVLSDQTLEVFRAMQLVDAVQDGAHIATRIRAARLYASIGEQLPNEYTNMHIFDSQFPEPPTILWITQQEHPAPHLVDSDADYILDDDLPDFSDEEDVDSADTDSEGPITPEQVPADNGHTITTIEDIEQIEEIDLGATSSSMEARVEAHFGPVSHMKKHSEASVSGTKVVDQPNESASHKFGHFDADQARLFNTMANMWRLANGIP